MKTKTKAMSLRTSQKEMLRRLVPHLCRRELTTAGLRRALGLPTQGQEKALRDRMLRLQHLGLVTHHETPRGWRLWRLTDRVTPWHVLPDMAFQALPEGFRQALGRDVRDEAAWSAATDWLREHWDNHEADRILAEASHRLSELAICPAAESSLNHL